MWKAAEIKARKTRMAKIKGRRSKGRDRKETGKKEEERKRKQKREKTMEVKKVAEEWEIWKEEEEAAKLEVEAKKLVLEKFHKWIKVFSKKKLKRMSTQKIWDHAIDMKEEFVPRKGKVYLLLREEREEV